MPSIAISNISGGQRLYSGTQFSGQPAKPVGGVQLVWSPSASGNAYVGLSGGVTVTSGGLMDGIPIQPGGGYFVPKLGIALSGQCNIFVLADAAASGNLMTYEIF